MRQTSPPMQSAPEPDDDTLMAAYAQGDAAASIWNNNVSPLPMVRPTRLKWTDIVSIVC